MVRDHQVRRLIRAVGEQPFASIDDLAARTELEPRVVRRMCSGLVEKKMVIRGENRDAQASGDAVLGRIERTGGSL